MQQKIFTIFDTKAEAYLPPFYLPTLGMAVRAVTESANDPNHMFGKYPADYTLFELGEFNDAKAKFTLLQPPKLIGCCLEFVAPFEPTGFGQPELVKEN